MATNELAKTNKKQLLSLLESPSIKGRLKDILGKNAPTFATSIVQIQSQNAMLQEATPESIIGAALTSATLNLPLNNSLGLAWIVPFKEKQPDNTQITKAQFQIGYKGFRQLCIRSGQFKFLNTTDVRQDEIKYINHLSGEITFEWEQDYEKRKKLPVVGYLNYYELLNGYRSYKFMTVDEVKKHGQTYSQTFKRGFGNWKDDFESMALKTVCKLHLAQGDAPISIGEALGNAVRVDQATIDMNENLEEEIRYPDNSPPVETDHDLERQKILVDNIETMDDVILAEAHVTHPTLVPVLEAKKLALEKRKSQ